MIDTSLATVAETLQKIEFFVLSVLDSKKTVAQIENETGLEHIKCMRAGQWLENKGLLSITSDERETILLGKNGEQYKIQGLPERQILSILTDKKRVSKSELEQKHGLNHGEIQSSIGFLKSRQLITIEKKENDLMLVLAEEPQKNHETTFLEEQFLEQSFPIDARELSPEMQFAYDSLKKRKDIVKKETKKAFSFEPTDLGKQVHDAIKEGTLKQTDQIGEITSDIIRNKTWEQTSFRRIDIHADVPQITGSKRHFVSDAISYGRKIWTELGFKEMTGKKTVTSFWNFDALFTAQDHPVREMQDTFYIKNIEGKLPDKPLVSKVKQAHETGVDGSSGWQYTWKEENAKQVLIRTHTTCLSSQTLSHLSKEELPAKFFSIGKCFRNETIDWSHGFEFNQSEGIVVDPNANLRHLIGYLRLFAKKMGYEKIRIQPAFFPYTEPSLEGAVWNEEKQEWVEVLAAGIFRPEVTVPLLGSHIPVLAWGPGFDRLMMKAHQISDLRELYKNDLKKLKEKGLLVSL
jgi:phenylalanyl-tRNA synthetase alpha chain